MAASCNTGRARQATAASRATRALRLALAAGTCVVLAAAAAAGAGARPAAHAAPVPHIPPPTGQNTWNGEWTTIKGRITFQQAGTLLAGYTAGYLLQIVGAIDNARVTVGGITPATGRTLTATWQLTGVKATKEDSGSLRVYLSDDGHVFTGQYTTNAEPKLKHPFNGTCAGGDCLLNARIVPIETVSNGCGGGGWDAFTSAQNLLADKHSYPTGLKGDGRRFTVDFRDACNLHDAGYAGAIVRDKLDGNAIVDYRGTSREGVDTKFLIDMHTLCSAGIPEGAGRAREYCGGTGSAGTIGAGTLYNFVRAHGYLFYDYDLTRPGTNKLGKRGSV